MSKYFIITVVLVLCVFSGIKAETENPLITEIQLTQGDSLYRYLYVYNEGGVKTLETKYVQLNESWLRREQTEWIFTNGLCTEQHVRVWKNNDWRPSHLIRFNYINSDLQSEVHYDTSSGAETNLLRTDYRYAENRLNEKTVSGWINNNWIILSRNIYVYNDNSLTDQINLTEYNNGVQSRESKVNFTYTDFQGIKSILVSEKKDDNWINSSLTTYYYQPTSNLKSSEIVKLWDTKYGGWVNSQSIDYQYDTSNRLSEENYLYWDIAVWANMLKYSYSYDTSGSLLQKTTFFPIYDDYRAAWSIQYSDFQYSKASLIEARNDFWGGETGALINTFIPYQFNNEMVVNNASRVKISYIPVLDTSNPDVSTGIPYNQIKVYPNPSKAIFYYNSEEYDVKKWVISDLSGKIILTKEQKERSGVIDLGDFKSGIYLLQVFTADGIKVQRLIKE